MTTGQHDDESPTELTVRYVGETYRPESELTFGREAELCLDDNNYLHRRAGRFRLFDGTWWLDNLGSRLRLSMVSTDGSLIELQPGDASPLAGTAGDVSLIAGPTRYQLDYELQGRQTSLDNTQRLEGGAGVDTMTYGVVLTPRELDFVVVMAQGRLTGRLGPLPTHGQIAETWGVSHKTVDNTLQRLRDKLRKQKISYVQSTETMIDYLVTQGLVTRSDLEWACLDSADGPRPSATRRP